VTTGDLNGEIEIESSESLSGYWVFDEAYYNGSDFLDVSGSSRSIPKNDNTPFVETSRGKSLKFNGSLDTMYLPRNEFNYERGSNFSVVSWIRPTDVSDSVIIGRQQVTSPNFPGWKLQLESNGALSFWMIKNFDTGNYMLLETETNVTGLKGWTQVGVSYDGSSQASGVKLFVNGTEAETDVKKNNLTSDFDISEDTSFGGLNFNVFHYTGYIDSIRTYNSVLEESRIREIYELRD
jgi:hypothetical protein